MDSCFMHPGKSACGANRRSIQAALNKEDEPCAGKSGVKAASDSQRLHSCFKCLIVSILLSHPDLLREAGRMHLYPLGKNSLHILSLCVCPHPHEHTQVHAGGGLVCKADRHSYPLNGSMPEWCSCIGFFHF